MTRLDRYIIGELIAAFGFFLLVFTGVVWLTQAVRLIDTVIASGETARVFLEFSALVVPQVFTIVLPLSGIGAALFTLNKLFSESELVVMMAAGLSPFGLLRPVAMFGVVIGVAAAVAVMALVPLSGAVLAERTQAIRSDIANALVVERQFVHPMPGLTLFITDTSRAGEMAGLFLNDQRDYLHPVTYSAKRAQLLHDGMEARLVMFDGVALSLDNESQQVNTVHFDQFVFDLSDMLSSQSVRVPRPSEYSVLQLLFPSEDMLASGKFTRANFVAEAHYKLTLPMLAMLYPMVALVTILAGGYRRSGFGRRVFVAIGLSALLQILTIVTRARVQEVASLWPAMYLPLLLGVAYIGIMTLRLSRARRPARLPA